MPRGTSLLPRDLSDDQLAAAPILASIDGLLIEDLSEDEDDAFAAALRSGESPSTPAFSAPPSAADVERSSSHSSG
jgi:hypothetical protein